MAKKTDKLILALPKGRILGEVLPLLKRAGIEPEPEFSDPNTRKLRFDTNDPGIEIIRVRAFDVATFVAFGAAHFGVAGSDVNAVDCARDCDVASDVYACGCGG